LFPRFARDEHRGLAATERRDGIHCGIVKLAAKAMRHVNDANNLRYDCRYKGKCAEPETSSIKCALNPQSA